MSDKLKACPKCGGTDKLYVASVDLFDVNSGKFLCRAVKTHDRNAPVRCFACDWRGEQAQLVEEAENE